MAPDGEPRFYWDAPNEAMLAQLTRDVADAWENKTKLTAIVDDTGAGGVIAYGLGEENSDTILTALRAMNRDTLFVVMVTGGGSSDLPEIDGPYLGEGPAQEAAEAIKNDSGADTTILPLLRLNAQRES